METKLRRCRSALITDGGGIIALGLWSIIKVIIQFSSPSVLFDSAGESGVDPVVELVLDIIGLVFIIGVVIFTHLYIGVSAYKEGISGKKKGSFYLVAAGFVFVFLMLGLPLYFLPRGNEQVDYISLSAAVFIDITKATIMLDMIIAAIRSRTLSKRLEQ